MKKFMLITVSGFIVLLLSGCGYHLGTFANPQIKTIAIAPITNDTIQISASALMRQALIDRFHFDGAYKTANMHTADAVLYGKITSIEFTAANILTATDGVTFMTKEFGVTLEFSYSVVIPGRSTPVVPQTSVSESVQFQVPVDLFPARQSGIKQAARTVAEKVVWRCTEGW